MTRNIHQLKSWLIFAHGHVLIALLFLICLFAPDAIPQGKGDLWYWKQLSGREIADAYEAILPSLRREFDISLDSLKVYIVYPEAHENKGRIRIRFTFYHPAVDTVKNSNKKVMLMVRGFPNYFTATYYPGTRKTMVEWSATPAQKALADSIVRTYIHKYFKIGPDSLKKYYVKYISYLDKGQKRIALDFLHPTMFPEPERVSGIFGGWPSYFSVVVDVKRKKVVQWYASQY